MSNEVEGGHLHSLRMGNMRHEASGRMAYASLSMGVIQHTPTHERGAEDDPKKRQKGGGKWTARNLL